MRSLSLPLVLLAFLGFISVGAGCNGQKAEPPKEAASAAPAKREKAAEKPARIDKLERIDTSSLTDAERKTFFDLANELLSPCGDPVSLARCVSEARGCGSCVPAARYLLRLVSEGYEKAEIAELFANRFDPKRKVVLDTTQAPVRGEPMAKISIVEFSDFECPHCGAAHPVLTRVLGEFQGKVNLAFKHFPLDSHKNAAPAARAAVAAQAQGKFWEMADLLFENQRSLTPDKIREIAKKIGLDMAKFDAAIAKDAVRDRVEADKREGAKVGVEGTPTFFINGRVYNGSPQTLGKYLKEELEL
jgi:protein-disulfide isomerase